MIAKAKASSIIPAAAEKVQCSGPFMQNFLGAENFPGKKKAYSPFFESNYPRDTQWTKTFDVRKGEKSYV